MTPHRDVRLARREVECLERWNELVKGNKTDGDRTFEFDVNLAK
jgi:hypothetical protein